MNVVETTARKDARDATDEPVADVMRGIGVEAKKAAKALATASSETKNAGLDKAARAIRASADAILAANADDMVEGEQSGLSKPLLNRLRLNPDRVEAMARGLEEIAQLPDPVGAVMDAWERPNGLHISRVRVPLGVIGIIYESRPNVTADAGALCLKSGNAAILRGGSESFRSSRAIAEALGEGLAAAALPRTAIQLVPTRDRAAVAAMLDMPDAIDVIVPRGGRGLVERVMTESKVPLFLHLEGVCHTYVDGAADPEIARRVTVNAKMRRPEICGATETLLVDRRLSDTLLPVLVDDLISAGCEVRGDDVVQSADSRAVAASDADWDTEYLDAVIAVRVVDGLDGALAHIDAHNSQHTEAIITEDADAARRFTDEVQSAIVMVNASTQFADGGEFGMGAEIGISTGKLHARGPVGVEQLTTFKYVVRGTGQSRP
ncbi:MAG: glutamate-5-semialdehyde dehydrogenase [Rhodospirillales bacterium]|jgi:glutamate-5-semialdehyde dehydrogenase|nr:glutamate-5-semialdehyde dehydrogenase [Rhodospirillales bacterium]MDP6804786.1 glutamate-5-semialdehyde dehydrogenase [Rhodospirillales bacterium]